eukprot:5029229-Ditylum_brightwellii.AAC.1
MGAFTGTSGTQSSHRHHDAGATLLVQKLGNGTNDVGGLYCGQNRSRRHCPPVSMMHREHHISGEGGGGDVGG